MLMATQYLSYQIIARKGKVCVKKYSSREDFKGRMRDNKLISDLFVMNQAFSKLII